jgi:soluble lytic murein transglycosylase-like protein
MHTVQPGETLWSIAAANDLSTAALAAANGLPPEAHVIAGARMTIPAPQQAVVDGPQSLGSYVVRLGDTLSGIAARSGASQAAVAEMNGLDPTATLLAGTLLKLPMDIQPAEPGQVPAARIVPDAPPHPTDERLSSATISQIAAAEGVPESLAVAIAWQESGFDNSTVSDANARGVMQLLPGTWAWINDALTSSPLEPSSAIDNVRAGVLYLGELLRDTQGDVRTTIAAYYQGLGSVRQIGVLPQTRQYVDDVLALRQRFGGCC